MESENYKSHLGDIRSRMVIVFAEKLVDQPSTCHPPNSKMKPNSVFFKLEGEHWMHSDSKKHIDWHWQCI